MKILQSRNLDIGDEQSAKHYLAEYSYYDLSNDIGKKYSYKSKSKHIRFFDGISFQFLVKSYIFDQDIRRTLFPQILNIEKSLDTKLAHRISYKIGVNAIGPNGYLNGKWYSKYSKSVLKFLKDYAYYDVQLSAFNYQTKERTGIPSQAINELMRDYDENKKIYASNSLKYYLRYHNHVPSWILMTTLTFGIIIHWFNILKPHDKSNVILHLLRLWNTNAIKEKQNVKSQDINRIVFNCLRVLNKYRNACAHGEVLNTVRCKNIVVTGHTSNADLLSRLLFTKNSSTQINNDNYNKGELYACILSVILLTDDHYQLMKFMRKIYSILKNREKYLKSINKSNLIKLDIPNNIMDVLKKLIAQETKK